MWNTICSHLHLLILLRSLSDVTSHLVSSLPSSHIGSYPHLNPTPPSESSLSLYIQHLSPVAQSRCSINECDLAQREKENEGLSM